MNSTLSDWSSTSTLTTDAATAALLSSASDTTPLQDNHTWTTVSASTTSAHASSDSSAHAWSTSEGLVTGSGLSDDFSAAVKELSETTTTPTTAAAAAFSHGGHTDQTDVTTVTMATGTLAPSGWWTLSDMELHFVVVGCLFAVVVFLALANLFIHLWTRGQNRIRFVDGEGRVASRMPSFGSSGDSKRMTYTTKMKPKSGSFL